MTEHFLIVWQQRADVLSGLLDTLGLARSPRSRRSCWARCSHPR